MRTHACVCAQSISCMSSQSKNNNPLLRQINLSCCRSRWSWMSTRAHEYRLVIDNHARECIVRRQPLHAYVWRWCVHACLNTQHWCGTCVKNRTLAPHIEQDWFMMCRCTSHFDSMGGIHAYTCMCMCSSYIMHVISRCQAKVVMDQAGPQMESIDIADNRLSGCERTTTTTLHVGQTYIWWIPKMHNFDVPHASKTVNHAPT